MAIKITKQIGTDQGITDEAYLRIEGYEFHKQGGILTVKVSMYLNEEAAASDNHTEYNGTIRPSLDIKTARNNSIPTDFAFPLTSSITTTEERITTQDAVRTVTFQETDDEGNVISTGSREENYVKSVTSSIEVVKSVIDIAPITGSSIFDFAYPMVAAKLGEIVGSEYVENC